MKRYSREVIMQPEKVLYILTFTGLYLELAGAFLLSAEAIGFNHLLRIAATIRRHRILGFAFYFILVIILLILTKLKIVLHFPEAFVLILSLGLLHDFGPRIIEIIVRRLEKGTAGIVGFILFSLGFVSQAYVSLSLLY